MKAVFDERQWKHDPKHFMANGTVEPNPEQPERIKVLTRGAGEAGCEFVSPEDHGAGPIAAIHSPEYLVFLETIHTRWKRIEGASDEVIPNIHPDRRSASYPRSAVGQAGFHQADTACPIAEGTWEAAYWSAQTALTGVDLVLDGERAVYALSRPPGHHAFGDLAGGFCFLNNSAIAAEHFNRVGKRAAILDVDVHHGNGTQGIFYERDDVLTVSIHADPVRFYPFFWGHAHERGEGRGRGYNLNLPLARGTGDQDYLKTLDTALARIRAFGADVLVVALGLDAYEKDPLKGLAVTTPGFAKIAEAIAEAGLSTLLVQEGGYLSKELGQNLTSFLKGFEGK
ncbi:histone deacetylase family protein [Rhizobiales bacterium]|uniref:histone deacetylase family protein n=1 Tax=Hongsoonwoonella zoysiae TaxID=2821844 RepID=UPI001560F4D2|nr:histone deacetylase family protein [Hongsoonwoonella zoysiae]NRG18178.1 histone deacetylase family protein [Hongsoonwoonella zoysiae]